MRLISCVYLVLCCVVVSCMVGNRDMQFALTQALLGVLRQLDFQVRKRAVCLAGFLFCSKMLLRVHVDRACV